MEISKQKIKEENNLNPISNYSFNKAIAESFCKKFYEEKNGYFDIKRNIPVWSRIKKTINL